MAAAAAKKGRSRKALNAIPDSDVNISAEKGGGLAAILSPQKSKRVLSKNKKAPAPDAPAAESFADELQDLQEKLQKLRIEKEKTEELLRERDVMLQEKEEEIENRGKERERLQAELKKLQKMKEFKPTVSFPFVKSSREKEDEGDEEKKKTATKKKKKKKNCAERKKPCPAYILWCRDQWNEIKRESSEADFKEVSNALGAKWKALSAEEKQPYDDKYRQEKEAYLQVVGQEKRENEAMKLLEEEQMQKTAMELLEQYLQFKQEADNNKGKKVRKEKDPSKPKQPMSAFFLFSKERRSRSALLEENKNVREIAKIAGEEWKSMAEEQRAPYEEIAKKEKEEYNRRMEIYKQKKLEEAAALEKEEEEQKKVLKQEALQLLKKKEKTENIIKKTKETHQKKKKQKEDQNTDPNKPKKPASSFLLFSKETRKKLIEERPGISNTTLNALISVKWKELSDEEKQIWNNKAAEGMAIYKKEMEEYNKSISTANNIAVPNNAP